jgi:hypothetical protein
MEAFAAMYHAVEKLSVGQAAAAGGAGAGISIATVLSVDPAAWAPWLQVATLSVGFLTGVVSKRLPARPTIPWSKPITGMPATPR